VGVVEFRPEIDMSDSHTQLSEPAPATASAAALALARAWQTAVVALLGAFIVLAVGFAGLAQIHDAAHDTRHTMNFPCH
jgi:cobalt transporter subunit CbtB